jgi:hypothetical protein
MFNQQTDTFGTYEGFVKVRFPQAFKDLLGKQADNTDEQNALIDKWNKFKSTRSELQNIALTEIDSIMKAGWFKRFWQSFLASLGVQSAKTKVTVRSFVTQIITKQKLQEKKGIALISG